MQGIPGQPEYDAAVTSFQNGQYGNAAIYGTAMLAQQFAAVLPVAAVYSRVTSTVQAVRVASSTSSMAASLGRRALSETIDGTQRKLLGQFVGNGVQGAEASLARLQAGGNLPQGLSRQTLETYGKIAQQSIDANKDALGTQAARLALIKEALKQGR